MAMETDTPLRKLDNWAQNTSLKQIIQNWLLRLSIQKDIGLRCCMIKLLKAAGFTSSLSYLAGFASVAASIAIWRSKKGRDEAHAERFGIFVGLWAPTFFAIGNGLDAAAARGD